MSIRISANGLMFEINRAFVNKYIHDLTRGRVNTSDWLENATEDDIQALVNVAIEQNWIYYCE